MAESNCTCAQCDSTVPPIITKLGKVSKHARSYCSDSCRNKAAYERRSLKASKPPKRRKVQKACGCCGSIMILVPSAAKERKFCSRKCKADSRRTGSRDRPCDVCGTTFRPIRTKGDLIEGRSDGRRYDVFSRHCSVECGRISSNATRALQYLIARESRLLLQIKENVSRRDPVRVSVAAEIASLRRIGLSFMQKLPWQGGPKVIKKPCIGCSAEFASLRSLVKTLCTSCASERLKEHRKKHKRIYKAKRRAVTRGRDADQIDPIKVFERDKWRCKICGVKAPKGKRGLEVDDAPQLDHITSLADGGDHTWANVQCLCRKCNLNKGAKSFGQLHLIAA